MEMYAYYTVVCGLCISNTQHYFDFNDLWFQSVSISFLVFCCLSEHAVLVNIVQMECFDT